MSCIAPVFLVQSHRAFHTVVYQFFQQCFEVIHVCYRSRIPVFSQSIFDCCFVVDHTSAFDTEWEAVQFSVCSGDTVLCTTICCPGFITQIYTFFFTDRSNVLWVTHDQCRSILCCISGRYFLRRCTTTDGVNFQFCSCQFSPLFSGSFQLRFDLTLCVQHGDGYAAEISACAVCGITVIGRCAFICCCSFTLGRRVIGRRASASCQQASCHCHC